MSDEKSAAAPDRSVLLYVRVGAIVLDKANRSIAQNLLVHFVVNLNAGAHCCCNVD